MIIQNAIGTFLQEVSVSAVSSQPFINLASTGFVNFNIIFSAFSTTAASVSIQYSINNGSSYVGAANYSSSCFVNASNSATWSNVTLTSGLLLSQNIAITSLNGNYFLYNMNTASNYIFLTGMAEQYNGTIVNLLLSTGRATTQSAKGNAFQVLVASGTMSGTISLYGLS